MSVSGILRFAQNDRGRGLFWLNCHPEHKRRVSFLWALALVCNYLSFRPA